MESLSTILLIVSIALIGFNIIVLCAFAVYAAVRWYRIIKKRKPPVLEKRQISYLHDASFKTRAIPMAFDELFYLDEDGFKKTKHQPLSSRLSSTSREHLTSEDLDISSYYASVSTAEELNEEEAAEKPPSLLISFSYNVSLLELNVVLVRGKDFLQEEESESTNHIIVSVVLLPDGNIRHSSRGVPPSPLFKDKFIFPITAKELKASSIKLNVWQIDKYSRKFPNGEIIISMQKIFSEQRSLYSSTFEMWREVEIKETLTNQTSIGELLTSLQYLPGAERVNVTIMKGRDLKFEEFDKDVYVKVSAIVNGKVMKNKKTSVMRKTAMPLFNEITSFELLPHSKFTLENMGVILSVYAYRSRGPYRRLIGRAVVGETEISNEAGRRQWRKMVEMPQKSIAEWQELR